MPLTKQALTTITPYDLVLVIISSLISMIIVLTALSHDLTKILIKIHSYLMTQLYQTITTYNPNSTFQSLKILPQTVKNNESIACPSFIPDLPNVFKSFHMLIGQTSSLTLCKLYYISLLTFLCGKSKITTLLHGLNQ